MLIDIELEKSPILAQVAVKVVNFQMQPLDVLRQVVLVAHDQSTFRTNLLFLAVTLQVRRQLLLCLALFPATLNRARDLNAVDCVINRYVIRETSRARERLPAVLADPLFGTVKCMLLLFVLIQLTVGRKLHAAHRARECLRIVAVVRNYVMSECLDLTICTYWIVNGGLFLVRFNDNRLIVGVGEHLIRNAHCVLVKRPLYFNYVFFRLAERLELVRAHSANVPRIQARHFKLKQ
jgi:hypothetical protein